MSLSIEKQISSLYEQIKTNRFADAEKAFSYCEELEKLADKVENHYAKSYALLYKSDTSLTMNHAADCLLYSTKAIQYMQEHQIESLLSAAYNLIAVSFEIKHDTLTAFSYYFKGLDVAIQTNDAYMQNMLYSNIAAAFSQYDAELSLKYILKSDEVFPLPTVDFIQNTEDDSVIYNYENRIANTSIALIHAGQYQNALDKFLPYLACCEDGKPVFALVPFYYVFITAYHRLGMIYEAEAYCREAVSYFDMHTEHSEDTDLIFQIIKEAIELGLYEGAKKIIDILSFNKELAENDTNSCSICQRYIEYYMKMQDADSTLQYYRTFRTYQQKRMANLQYDYISSIENKLALEQELELNRYYQKDNKELSDISQKDALTGLYNRYGLHHYYKNNFIECCHKKETFGIMIIDIDNFKTYNDTNGHLEGDNCIKQIAALIMHSCPDCYCARYGGDEFFVICRNLTYEAFEAHAKDIVNAARIMQLPFTKNNPQKYVTVSIGAVIAVPVEKQTVSEFISCADSRLYQVKKRSRNDYSIADSITEKETSPS